MDYTITAQDLEGGKSPRQVLANRQVVEMVNDYVYRYFNLEFQRNYPKEFEALAWSEAAEWAKLSKNPDADLSLQRIVHDGMDDRRKQVLRDKYGKEIERMAVDMITKSWKRLSNCSNRESN